MTSHLSMRYTIQGSMTHAHFKSLPTNVHGLTVDLDVGVYRNMKHKSNRIRLVLSQQEDDNAHRIIIDL